MFAFPTAEDHFNEPGYFKKAEFFAQLDKNFPALVSAALKKAWKAVVKIEGRGTSRLTGKTSMWEGTGFLLDSGSVVTSRQNLYEAGCDDATLTACFDWGLRVELVRPAATTRPQFSSLLLAVQKERLDMVVLHFGDVGNDAQKQIRENTATICWESSDRLRYVEAGTPVVLIGHPLGSEKHASICTLTEAFSWDKICCQYTSAGSRLASCGSAVFFLSTGGGGTAVCALHVADRCGVAFVDVITDLLMLQVTQC